MAEESRIPTSRVDPLMMPDRTRTGVTGFGFSSHQCLAGAPPAPSATGMTTTRWLLRAGRNRADGNAQPGQCEMRISLRTAKAGRTVGTGQPLTVTSAVARRGSGSMMDITGAANRLISFDAGGHRGGNHSFSDDKVRKLFWPGGIVCRDLIADFASSAAAKGARTVVVWKVAGRRAADSARLQRGV